MDRQAWQATVHGVTRVRHNLATKEGMDPKCWKGFYNEGRNTHTHTHTHTQYAGVLSKKVTFQKIKTYFINMREL